MAPAPLLSISRRAFLASTALAGVGALPGVGMNAQARTYSGGALPTVRNSFAIPVQIASGPWVTFTPLEGRTIEAIVERLIPADDLGMSGKDAGCAVFIDRQLAGAYGQGSRRYNQPPFQDGLPTQGDQSAASPAERYKVGLAALDRHCKATFSGKGFAELIVDERDKVLTGLESGDVTLDTKDAAGFFALVHQNTMEGFFADPIYGGNRNMVSWRMIGFPGTRYDFRDYLEKHNEPYPLPPVAILGAPAWIDRS